MLKLEEFETFLGKIKTHKGYAKEKFHYLREYENPCKIREFSVIINYNRHKNIKFLLIGSSINK